MKDIDDVDPGFQVEELHGIPESLSPRASMVINTTMIILVPELTTPPWSSSPWSFRGPRYQGRLTLPASGRLCGALCRLAIPMHQQQPPGAVVGFLWAHFSRMGAQFVSVL